MGSLVGGGVGSWEEYEPVNNHYQAQMFAHYTLHFGRQCSYYIG